MIKKLKDFILNYLLSEKISKLNDIQYINFKEGLDFSRRQARKNRPPENYNCRCTFTRYIRSRFSFVRLCYFWSKWKSYG